MTLSYAKCIKSTRNGNKVDSVISTVEVFAPRFLLAEINTHGLLAKSAASSRAIPTKKRIEQIRHTPFIPDTFSANKPGMQAGDALPIDKQMEAERVWRAAAHFAAGTQERLEELGVHKQWSNRIGEPFTYYHGVITATEWDNFYALRISDEAQPEFDELAKKIKAAIASAPISIFPWHTPYTELYHHEDTTDALRVSAARCARVSYKTFDGKESTVEADVKLCEQLLTSGHMSPFDHVAKADGVEVVTSLRSKWENPTLHGRFWGWVPYRTYIEQQSGKKSRRNSHDYF